MRKRILLFAAVLALFGTDVFGWGRGHKLIRQWAVQKLPQWQKEFVGAEHLNDLYRKYTSLQDAHAGGHSPQYDRYCIVPGVHLSLHDVCDARSSLRAMQWYIDQIGKELKAGKGDEAMKFLGVLCHWVEDPASPTAHGSPTSDAILRQLIPPPREKENFNYILGYGGIGDVGKYTVPDEAYTPRLLGASIPEAAGRIYQAQRMLKFKVGASFVPIIQDTMYGDGTKADAERSKAALVNAKRVADIIYTVLCLAANKVDAGESEKLKTQRLTEWLSDSVDGRAGHPYYVVPYLINQSMDAKRKLHPLAFSGDGTPVEFGFGTGTPSNIKFSIGPGGVFSKFTCRAGLHPTAGPKGKVKFTVRVAGRAAWEKTMAVGDAPEAVSVDLPAKELVSLTLQTAPVGGSPPLHNLVVWAEPTLHRSATAPVYSSKPAPKGPAGAPQTPTISDAKGTNILKNSSLETWGSDGLPVDWGRFSAKESKVGKETSEVHSGKAAARFEVDENGSVVLLNTTWENKPGKRYRYSFYWKSPVGYVQYAIKRSVPKRGWIAYSGVTWKNENANPVARGSATEWNRTVMEFDAFEEPLKLTVEVCRPSGKGSSYSFFVDDITLEELE